MAAYRLCTDTTLLIFLLIRRIQRYYACRISLLMFYILFVKNVLKRYLETSIYSCRATNQGASLNSIPKIALGRELTAHEKTSVFTLAAH
jgi:hypothetical protein